LAENIWSQCRARLREALPPQQFNTWIKPLRAYEGGGRLRLCAPNRFIGDFVMNTYSDLIAQSLTEVSPSLACDSPGVPAQADAALPFSMTVGLPDASGTVSVEAGKEGGGANPVSSAPDGVGHVPVLAGPSLTVVGGNAVDGAEGSLAVQAEADSQPGSGDDSSSPTPGETHTAKPTGAVVVPLESRELRTDGDDADPGAGKQSRSLVDSTLNFGQAVQSQVHEALQHQHNLVAGYTFATFVEGKSNQLALAAASQVAENPGEAYNPLFLYGGVGLGKTHLMHAVGNALKANRPDARIVYLHSERFVADMVKALQINAISDFKRYYRSVDALLIDDIQFFAKKDRSQEEFFHTFNALLEGGQQMILTCDRYPKEIDGLEERLKSRFGWGLTVAVEPPDLETRVAILMNKASRARLKLPHDAAFFIAQRIRSNVRELEGALKRVIASANFTRREISVELVKESLKDLLALQDKQVSLDNIQRTVAEYYKMKVADLNSRRRNRSVARPRQVAMALAKELTNYSLPEIGDSFGGRDHTTVLHACRKIKELRETSSDIHEDYKNLMRLLTT